MKIVVLSDEEIFEALSRSSGHVNWIRVDEPHSFAIHADASAFFVMNKHSKIEYAVNGKPLFINSVAEVLPAEINAVRINGWHGFLENDTWEVAGNIEEQEKEVLNFLGKKIIECADEPGFIAARIIAMIINEAFYAREQGVSTTTEIDTAMKLGTNYPYGPFEWGQKIGLKHIHSLLQSLALTDNRYKPALSLTNAAVA